MRGSRSSREGMARARVCTSLSVRRSIISFITSSIKNSIQYAVAILWDGARVVCKARVSATLWDRSGAFRDWVAAPLWVGSGDTWD